MAQESVNLVKTKVTPTSEFPPDVPKPKFLVDDNGHLLHRDPSKSYRNRKEKNATMQGAKSFMEAPQTGSYGFSFTPVGYNSAAERPNVILKGVRPGCRESNPNAHQTLHKYDTEYTEKTKDLRKTYKDKMYQSYSWQVPKPTKFRD